MGRCRKASKRRRQPECSWCEHTVRRGVEQHLKRCQVFRREQDEEDQKAEPA
jgi:hypothetical protein